MYYIVLHVLSIYYHCIINVYILQFLNFLQNFKLIRQSLHFCFQERRESRRREKRLIIHVYTFFPSFSYFITWRISRYRKATGEPGPLEVLNFHESDKMASKQITAWFPALFPLPLFPVTFPSRLCAWVPVNSRSQIHAPFSLSSHLDSFLFSRLLRICFVAKRKRIDEKLRFQAQISIATKPIPLAFCS